MTAGREIAYLVLIGVYPLTLIGAAASDIARLRIPNWIAAALFVAFPLAAWSADLSGALVVRGIGCAAVLLALGAFLTARGWFGGGDAKLLAAAGAWIGWPGVVKFLLLMAVIGGALALLLLVLRRTGLAATAASIPWLRSLHGAADSVPYGVAIAVSALAMFWELPVRTAVGH